MITNDIQVLVPMEQKLMDEWFKDTYIKTKRKEAEKLEQDTKKCKCLKMHNFRITYPKKHL